MFRCGDYVHHKTENLGNGRVIEVHAAQKLQSDDTIKAFITFTVLWLDQDQFTIHYEKDLVASTAAAPPKFDSVEQANAWMESQLAGGGWVGNVEDTNAVVAEIVQQAGVQLATEAATARIACGSEDCGCLDCAQYFEGEQYFHSKSIVCGCEERGCGCSR